MRLRAAPPRRLLRGGLLPNTPSCQDVTCRIGIRVGVHLQKITNQRFASRRIEIDRPGRVPRFLGAYRYRQYTVPLWLGVRDPGIAELRSIRVV